MSLPDFDGLFLVLGALFSPLAGLCAFAIVYDELRHHFPDKPRAFKLALQAGIAAALFFAVLIFMAGALLARE